jgi:hypothetical protein
MWSLRFLFICLLRRCGFIALENSFGLLLTGRLFGIRIFGFLTESIRKFFN